MLANGLTLKAHLSRACWSRWFFFCCILFKLKAIKTFTEGTDFLYLTQNPLNINVGWQDIHSGEDSGVHTYPTDMVSLRPLRIDRQEVVKPSPWPVKGQPVPWWALPSNAPRWGYFGPPKISRTTQRSCKQQTVWDGPWHELSKAYNFLKIEVTGQVKLRLNAKSYVFLQQRLLRQNRALKTFFFVFQDRLNIAIARYWHDQGMTPIKDKVKIRSQKVNFQTWSNVANRHMFLWGHLL